MRRIAWLAMAALMVVVCGISADAAEKKVLFIDSYHEGYAWSDGVTRGVKGVIGDKAELKIHRMDTKNNPSEEFKKQAAEKAKTLIEEWQPDVVIASDDNASKYLIEPFYKGKDLPFVFCGVNWNAGIYGFPAENVTGMEEVSLAEPLLKELKPFAKGDKIGYLAVDNLTGRKEAEYYQKKFGISLDQEVYVNTTADWKAKFKELQGQVDMLIVDNNAGLKDWDDAEIKAFVLQETKIPTGSIYDWIAPFVMVSYTKVPEEQGAWAAQQALKILDGASPADIPVVQNKKGKVIVNLPVAKALEVQIPLKLLKMAEVIKE